MPRKKVKKSRITKLNRKALFLSENMENDFRAIPNKLPAQFDKDINGLKKQENKLQSSLLKMQKQEAIAKNKHAALALKSKNNLTSGAKKQIKAAQKVLEAINAATLKLTAQLNDIKQHGKILSQKQAKFSTICKYIASLDKEWEKKNAKESLKAAKASKTTAKSVKKTPQKRAKKAEKPIAEESMDAVIPTAPAQADMIPETIEAAGSK